MMDLSLKRVLTLGLSGVISLSAAAETGEGVKYFKCGLFGPAKVLLLNDLKNGGESKAETCYYLGEVYCAEQKLDSAMFYYKQGASSDTEDVFNIIGEAKVLLKSDQVAANNLLSAAVSGKNRKNAAVLLAVSKAYAGVLPDKADEYLAKAKEADSKYADIYIVEGDRLLAQNEAGEACSRYEQAIYFDPACVEAYVKYARIYAHTSPQTGIDMLQKLEAHDPASVIAPREMAEIHYVNSHYGEAAKAYERLENSGYMSNKELTRYVTVLFYHGEFIRSFELAQKVLSQEPDNVVMKRISIYDLYELKEYDRGVALADEFFKTVKPDELIGQDYLLYGRLLLNRNKQEEAIPYLEKALKIDSTKVEVYKELALACEKSNNLGRAIDYYRHFVDKGGDQVKIADHFSLGRYCYLAGNALDTLAEHQSLRTAYFMEADSVFGYVATRVPDNYMGHFWRARVNSSLDPETEKGLAKPYYEAAAVILEKDPKKVSLLLECYSYLGYYFYVKKDIAASKDYWNKILVLDPSNDVAKKALEGMK